MKHPLISDAEIQSKTYPDPEWIIPDYMPEGYTLLAGLPKLGKSVIGLQIAEAVASAGMIFGKQVKKGRVLYIAVEDNERRLKHRMIKNGYTATNNIFFYPYSDMTPLDKGGVAELKQELTKKKYRVCILDTMYRMVSPKMRQNDSGDMMAIGDALQNVAKEGIVNSIIALTHHNKGAFFNENHDSGVDISGSISIAGAGDTLWSIYRKRGQPNMRVEVSGRDVDEQTIELMYDPLTKCYQLKPEVRESTVQYDILKLAIPNVPFSTGEIALALGKHSTNISRELNELIIKGHLIPAGKRGKELLYIKVLDVHSTNSFASDPKPSKK